MLLAIMLLAWVVTKTIHDGRVDHEYAKQGLVSPRLQAKYGPKAEATTARYGFTDYLKDAWSDHWQGRAAALREDRAVRAANPKVRVPLRERWAAARATAVSVAARAGRVLVEPVGGDKPSAEPRPGPASVTPLVESGDVPVGTVRHTDDGVEQWDGTRWQPTVGPEPVAEPADAEPVTAPVTEEDDVADEPADTTPTGTTEPTGGPAMTAPTGEAVNYETTISELEALAREQRLHVDSCTAVLKNAVDIKSAINDMQESYRAASAAAGAIVEHLASRNLDGVTLGHAGTAADAMPAGVVDRMYDEAEHIEAVAKERLDAAETALATTEANLAHVRNTYGAAHETVAGNLGGDSRFLDSGGAVHGNPAAEAPTHPEVHANEAGGREPATV